MKRLLPLCLLLCVACDDEKFQRALPKEDLPLAAPLPIVGYHKDSLRNLEIWELQHGWLVLKNTGYGTGLTFVPKPGQAGSGSSAGQL